MTMFRQRTTIVGTMLAVLMTVSENGLAEQYKVGDVALVVQDAVITMDGQPVDNAKRGTQLQIVEVRGDLLKATGDDVQTGWIERTFLASPETSRLLIELDAVPSGQPRGKKGRRKRAGSADQRAG